MSRIGRWIRRVWDAIKPPPEPKRRPTIAYITENGQQTVGKIVGTVGLYLDVRNPEGGYGAQLVSEHQAIDEDFWEQWRAWGGPELYFEDGSPYDPSDF